MDTYKSFQCSLIDYHNILHSTLIPAGCHKMCSPCNLLRNNRFVMLRDIQFIEVANTQSQISISKQLNRFQSKIISDQLRFPNLWSIYTIRDKMRLSPVSIHEIFLNAFA